MRKFLLAQYVVEVPGPIRGHRKTLSAVCPPQMMASLDNLGSPRAKCLGICASEYPYMYLGICECRAAPCECSFGVGFCVD